MPLGFAAPLLALVLAVVFLGGAVKGVVGFGYSVASTAVLALFIEPTTAVVLMIVPMLVGNVSLVRELSRDGLVSCVDRFWPYVAAAVAGVVAGMLFLDRVPRAWLALALGVLVLGYVAAKQDAVALPVALPAGCFTERPLVKVGMGLASGGIFGASNVGIQTVIYLDRLDLDRATFVGVLSMFLAVLSMVRVGMAMSLGLYDAGGGLLALSLVAAVLGLAGVGVGRRSRHVLPDRLCEVGVLAIFLVVGLRLTYGGAIGVLG